MEGDLVELVCTDTGVGLPDVASTSHTGLGMKITEVVCMELESDLDLRNSEDGVLAILRFAPQPL